MDTMALKSTSLRPDSPKAIKIDGYLTESKLSAVLQRLVPDGWLGDQVHVAGSAGNNGDTIRFMTATKENYEGCDIESHPEELKDGSGWAEDYSIQINPTVTIPFGSDRKFKSREEANAASIIAAKGIIDRHRKRVPLKKR
jgi:hypothetical protein